MYNSTGLVGGGLTFGAEGFNDGKGVGGGLDGAFVSGDGGVGQLTVENVPEHKNPGEVERFNPAHCFPSMVAM